MDQDITLLSLVDRNLPLCVGCRSCGHRALIEPMDITVRDPAEGRRTTIDRIARRLRCNQCRSRDASLSIPVTRRDAKRFLDAVRQ